MTTRRLSPIEMMIDRATGYDPSRPLRQPSRPMVTLRCPSCQRKRRVARERTDPKRAFYVEIPCDKCDDGGGKPETVYFDALNRQINPRTGKPFAQTADQSQET